MKNFIIGITGGSGVGKTTLIKLLYAEFKDKITTLSLDNYYLNKYEQALDENGVINFDLPSALNVKQLEQDFNRLLNNQAIQQKKYNFNNPDKKEEDVMVRPNEIILVEGLFVMHYPFVNSKLDYKVYLSVDEEKQLERRLKRDVEERNYNKDEVIYQWHNHVLPAYTNFVKPYKKNADLIITNNLKFDDNIHELFRIIHLNIDK